MKKIPAIILALFMTIAIKSIAQESNSDQAEFNCTIECKSNAGFSFWIYYATNAINQFDSRHSGVFIKPSDKYQKSTLSLPLNDLKGLKLVFYATRRAQLDIKKISFSYGQKEVVLSPDNLMSDVFWQFVDSIKMEDSHLSFFLKKDNKGIAAPLGILQANSMRRLYREFTNANYSESIITADVRSPNPLLLRVYFKEKDDIYYYRSASTYIPGDDSLRRHSLTFLSEGDVKGIKFNFFSQNETSINLSSLGYESRSDSRSWNPIQMQTELSFSSSLNIVSSNSEFLKLEVPIGEQDVDASMTFDREPLSRFKEMLDKLVLLLIFGCCTIIFLVLNRKLLVMKLPLFQQPERYKN